jgi:hypothetical protein
MSGAKIKNKCPKCKSQIQQPITIREHCEGPERCLSNVSGKHTHVMNCCPFCGHVFFETVEDGWK